MNAQPRASSGAFVCGTNPRARNCPGCGRPKTLLPQCVLGPASAGLFFLKTEAGLSRRCDIRRGITTSAPACAPLVRSSHAQAPAVLDHSCALPQGDGRAGASVAGGAERRGPPGGVPSGPTNKSPAPGPGRAWSLGDSNQCAVRSVSGPCGRPMAVAKREPRLSVCGGAQGGSREPSC